jgi:hypothetical protein
MNMQDWQQRVVTERSELCGRLAKLWHFQTTAEFAAMDGDDRSLMGRQAEHMQAYADILGKRIARFK